MMDGPIQDCRAAPAIHPTLYSKDIVSCDRAIPSQSLHLNDITLAPSTEAPNKRSSFITTNLYTPARKSPSIQTICSSGSSKAASPTGISVPVGSATVSLGDIECKTTTAVTEASSSVTEDGFIKRPLNSFMLYRRDHQHTIPSTNHQSISRIIGDMWRKESAETKNYYNDYAKKERDRHQREHPNYKFQPKKKSPAKVYAKTTSFKQNPAISSSPRASVKSRSIAPRCDISPSMPAEQKQYEWQPGSSSQQDESSTTISKAVPYSCLPYYPLPAGVSAEDAIPPQFSHYFNQFSPDIVERQQMIASRGEICGGKILKDPQNWHLIQNLQQLQDTSAHTRYSSASDEYSAPLCQITDAQPEYRPSTMSDALQWSRIDCARVDESLAYAEYANIAHATLPLFEYMPLDCEYMCTSGFPPGNMITGTWEMEF